MTVNGDLFEAYLFDLDGTVFIGDSLLPHVQSTIEYLRRIGKDIAFLTNTSVQTRRDCQRRLERFGLTVPLNEIITSAYMSGLYFSECYPDATVMLVGEKALADELEGFDIRTTHNPKLATHLLVGLDRGFNYEKLHRGVQALRRGPCLWQLTPIPIVQFRMM
ncbi:hypothetical protein N752_07845 [Desulforamulus aquiferis]|nr:hypothetical protein [Desulforamulus aquiferis]RYD05796.1 hypothetical protein N752_07845 [Desulforamulus aquiferis]